MPLSGPKGKLTAPVEIKKEYKRTYLDLERKEVMHVVYFYSTYGLFSVLYINQVYTSIFIFANKKYLDSILIFERF